MKTSSNLLVRFAAAMCVLSCFAYWGGGIAPSEAVLIGGKSLGSISDIVKTATGSDFPELPKHSLLIYERHQNGSQLRYKSNILTINPDGSVRKRFGDLVDHDSPYMPVGSTIYAVQKMDLAISPKRFGNRRNVVYATSGLLIDGDGNPDSMVGFQTIDSVGTEDNAKMTLPGRNAPRWTWGARQMWGNASVTIKGMEDKDVFVVAHSAPLGISSNNLYLYFLGLDRNENGSISSSHEDDGDIYLGCPIVGYVKDLWSVSIAAGDFDGDGYKNEIVVVFNDNAGVNTAIYRATRAPGHKIGLDCIYVDTVHGGTQSWGTDYVHQSSVTALAGDFDGDGKDEAAAVTKTNGLSLLDMRVKVYKNNGGSWSNDELTAYNDFSGTLKATTADLNGDGQDEIVLLVLHEYYGTIYPRLEFWGFNRGSIKPVRNVHCNKGGPGNTSLLGYSLGGNEYNQSFKTADDFCITAGPLTGKQGHIKLADDIVISHINESRCSVYVIPPVLNAERNFIAFGDTKTVWNYGSSSGRRGGVITADFANEALLLGEPKHTYDDKDDSYVTILQAMPYHVDNVDINGNLLSYAVNYTCSAFKGDVDTNGEMSVSYTRTDKSTTKNDITFNMASTTETIALLGDAGPYVHDYLKFRTMEANIAGNFDERAKAAADTMNTIMDFVTDKIDATTTNSTSSVKGKYTTQVDEALLWDKVISYSAGQHIWRYKILNDPMPSWYKLGLRADNRSKDLKAESQERYITFSMYDDPTRNDLDTTSTNTYQARHEEGNFFSYPSGVSQIEGYTASGALAEQQWVGWSKGASTGTEIGFTKVDTATNSYEDKIQESELNKTVSAIASLFGADDPNPLPPYTGHSETFTKSLEAAEAISIKLYGKSTIPGEEAGHRILSMPFIAREGTLKVGHAVELLQNARSRLWGSNSRYKKYPDPALVLPHKYDRSGSNIVATDNNGAAMMMRGLRFYIPDMDQYSDTNLVAGLKYEIRVPIYNASFVNADNFNVRLLYAKASEFDEHAPHTTMNNMKEIQTVKVSLKGWPENKDWARFTWEIPQDAESVEYVFFVQIDPKIGSQKQLEEVHESRLDYSTGAIIDVGGNNEGYFKFNITSMSEVTKKHTKTAAILAGELKPGHSDGVVYSAFYQKEQGAVSNGNVKAAVDILDRTGNITADVKLLNLDTEQETADFILLLGLMSEMMGVSPDKTVQVQCTVTYDGDEYYPEAYLNGVNLKPGVLGQVAERDYPLREEIESMFSVHRMALVPHSTTTFLLNVTPRAIDFENGAGFEFYIPELEAASVFEEIANSQEQETDTGDDPSVDPDPSTDPETPTSTVGSSGSGCDAFSFGLVALAGIALLTLKKSH